MNAYPASLDIDHILSSNVVPNSLERASLQDEIGQLDLSISQKRVELEALETQRRTHKAALSPIRRLPLEIIGQVIRLVAWGVLHAPGRRDLVTLSLVCRRWRQAALLCHEQWKGVHFKDTEAMEQKPYYASEKIVSWYSRAGTLPKILEFRLGCNDRYCECRGEEGDPSGCKFMNPTLVRLLLMGPILDHFAIQVTKPACLRNLLEAIGALNPDPDSGAPRSPWASLRSLEIEFSCPDYTPWNDAENASGSVLNSLPQVTALSILLPESYSVFGEDEEDARNVSIHVPPTLLRNLTSFNVQCDWHGNHILKMLEQCANLERLTINSAGKGLVFDETDPLFVQALASRLTFPRLHTLKLESQTTLRILDFIKAPALRHLSLEVMYKVHEEDDFCSASDAFIESSDCGDALLSLEIQNARVDPEELARWILKLHALRRLTLGRIPTILYQLLWALQSGVKQERELGDTTPLAHLEELVLTRVPTSTGTGSVVQFLKSLTTSKPRLIVTYDIIPTRTATEAQIVEELGNPDASVRIVPDEYLEWVYSG